MSAEKYKARTIRDLKEMLELLIDDIGGNAAWHGWDTGSIIIQGDSGDVIEIENDDEYYFF